MNPNRALIWIAAAALTTAGCGDGSTRRFASIGTGGTGGVYYPLGGALARMLGDALQGKRNGVVLVRRYMIHFNTLLGELFVNNLLASSGNLIVPVLNIGLGMHPALAGLVAFPALLLLSPLFGGLLAAQLVMHNQLEPALEHLLMMMRRDREYGDDAARKAMIQVFDILGDHPITKKYRTKMFNYLY